MASKQLSEFEKVQIVAYNDCGLSLGDIAKKLNCHHSSIDAFLMAAREKLLHLKIQKLFVLRSNSTWQQHSNSKIEINKIFYVSCLGFWSNTLDAFPKEIRTK